MVSSTALIETPRLLLRRPDLADAPQYLEIVLDPEVLKSLMQENPKLGIAGAEGNLKRLLREWDANGYGQWTVAERATGQIVGCVGPQYPDDWPAVEMAWMIRRTRWGQGFATEAARQALDWTWRSTRIDHVISMIEPDNAASIRIALKIGEVFERSGVDPISGDAVHIYGIHRPQ